MPQDCSDASSQRRRRVLRAKMESSVGVPRKLGKCFCGCGQRTNLIRKTDRLVGLIEGQPYRYIVGHNTRLSPLEYAVDKKTGCWVWQRALSDGYGTITRKNRAYGVHRIYFEKKYGPIPSGLTIDHLCRNRACVNPEHLEAVTMRENILRGAGVSAVNARKTSCPRGHPYDGLRSRPGGRVSRFCKSCRDR